MSARSEVTSLSEEFSPLAERLLALADSAAEAAGLAIDLSIVLADPNTMREIHARFAGSDEPTDVLSFTYGDSGEILLCPPLCEDVERALVHGILHLAGMEHEDEASERAMERAVNAIIG